MSQEFVARNGIISKNNLTVSGSLTTTGTITATTLVVQTVTSSISSITGSTNFGSLSSNTHIFTGSLYVSGALIAQNGTSVVLGTGTTNYLPKFTGASTIGNSQIQDDGTSVGIGGSPNASYKLAVTGASLFSSSILANSVMSLGDDGTYGATYKTLGLTGNTNGTHRIFAGTSDDMYLAAATGRGIYFWTDGSSATRMRILANGNVGIGTSSPLTLLHLNSPAGTNATLYFGVNGTANGYLGQAASAGSLSSGAAVGDIVLRSQTNLLFTSGGDTEKMRITSGYSVSYRSNNASNATFDLNYEFSSPISARIRFATTTAFNENEPAEISFWTRANDSQGGGSVTERMRITSGGDVLIGTTRNVEQRLRIYQPTSGNWNVKMIQPDGSSQLFTEFLTTTDGDASNTARGSIRYNGTNVLYLGTSDYRLKEDLRDYDALGIVGQLKTYDFKWKEAGTRDYGMMAHELQEVLPNYVTGQKDELNEDGSINPQQVDYSKLIPVLIKSIQELNSKVTALENTNISLQARVQELENK